MKQTKLLWLCNIRFFKEGMLLLMPLDSLELTDSVTVTFEMPKNDLKHKTFIHGQKDDPILCPVKQWAHLVNWIWTYLGTWRILQSVRFDTMTDVNRSHCPATIGSASLGFEPEEIGTHSFCSGATMDMYRAGVPVYTIMLIGRWSSDAFLHYIWKQVEQFLKDIAQKMLMHLSFWTIPWICLTTTISF